MSTFNKIEKDLLSARKANNVIEKNLLSTLKGEFENLVKNGQGSEENLLKLIKKFIKNAELVKTQVSLDEIEILKRYLPTQLSEEETRAIVLKQIAGAPDKVNNYKLGSKGVIGWFMGNIVKESQGNIDTKLVNQILLAELEK